MIEIPSDCLILQGVVCSGDAQSWALVMPTRRSSPTGGKRGFRPVRTVAGGRGARAAGPADSTLTA